MKFPQLPVEIFSRWEYSPGLTALYSIALPRCFIFFVLLFVKRQTSKNETFFPKDWSLSTTVNPFLCPALICCHVLRSRHACTKNLSLILSLSSVQNPEVSYLPEEDLKFLNSRLGLPLTSWITCGSPSEFLRVSVPICLPLKVHNAWSIAFPQTAFLLALSSSFSLVQKLFRNDFSVHLRYNKWFWSQGGNFHFHIWVACLGDGDIVFVFLPFWELQTGSNKFWLQEQALKLSICGKCTFWVT